MRRVLALGMLTAVCAAGVVQAESWKGYSAVTPKNLQWSYDQDYSYRDSATGRVVALTAVGKVGAEPRMGPSAPGAADGVGTLVALDCKASNLILIAGYSPGKALDIPDGWRGQTPKKIDDADDKALQAAVCAGADRLPVK